MNVKASTVAPQLSHSQLIDRLDQSTIHPRSIVRVRLQGPRGDEVLLPVRGVRVELADDGKPDYVELLT